MTPLEILLRDLVQADRALARARERAADLMTLVNLAGWEREQALRHVLAYEFPHARHPPTERKEK